MLGEGPIGEQIRQWRINLGLTVAEAARLSGVSGSVWGRIEAGATPGPLMTTVVKMFQGLGAKIEVTALPRPAKWQQESPPEPPSLTLSSTPTPATVMRADG